MAPAVLDLDSPISGAVRTEGKAALSVGAAVLEFHFRIAGAENPNGGVGHGLAAGVMEDQGNRRPVGHDLVAGAVPMADRRREERQQNGQGRHDP